MIKFTLLPIAMLAPPTERDIPVPSPPPPVRFFKETKARQWTCLMVDENGKRFDVRGVSPEFKIGDHRKTGGEISLTSKRSMIRGERKIVLIKEGGFVKTYHIALGEIEGFPEPTLNVSLYDHGGGYAFITSYNVRPDRRTYFASGVCKGNKLT